MRWRTRITPNTDTFYAVLHILQLYDPDSQHAMNEFRFSKKISLIDLGLHIGVFKNESYSAFVAKAGFTRKNIKVLFNIYTSKQKLGS